MQKILKWNNKIIITGLVAFINAIAITYYTEMGDMTHFYAGNQYYAWRPESLAFFALDCILVWRFLSEPVLRNRKRVIISTILGLLLSYLALWGNYMLYGTNAIFDNTAKVVAGIFAPIGFSFFIIPMFSELIGLVDALRDKKPSEENKVSEFFSKHRALYFMVMWVLFFAQFGILFLMFWPGVFAYDAAYQLEEYLNSSFLTHHPILSTLLIGRSYELGMKMGNVDLGYSFYTIIQMLILSSAFAFFMLYIKCVEKRKAVRRTVFLVFFLNPVNAHFSIASVKGVLCAAFTVYAITFLLFWISGRWRWINGALFVVTMILSCQFRNNMVYAFIIAGVAIALLQKGIRHRLIVAALVVCVIAGNKVLTKSLISATGAQTRDSNKESMSVPLQCIARVMIKHKDEIAESEYARMEYFIPEYLLSSYELIISDGIKNGVDEAKLITGKKELIKLWVKYGLKYPGDYIEQMVALTIGYWYPLEHPMFITGTTKLYSMPTISTEGIDNRDLTFFNGALTTWSSAKDGRVRTPLFAWFWRGAIYFWSFIFAFGYAIYAKRKEIIFVILIPLMYMLSCLLGPVSWLRYIYINIACLPMLVYSMVAVKDSFYKNTETK